MAREGIAGPDDVQRVHTPPEDLATSLAAVAPSGHDAGAEPVVVPPRGKPARPTTAAPRVVETKRPYHVGVALGVAAGLYAGSLALVTRWQVDHDQALIVDRQPVLDAIDLLDRHHDAMDDDLMVASTAYDDAAGGFDELVIRLADVHDDVAALAKRLRVIRRLAVVDGSGLTGLPRIVIDPQSPPTKAARRTSHASAPAPAVHTKTGASGGG